MKSPTLLKFYVGEKNEASLKVCKFLRIKIANLTSSNVELNRCDFSTQYSEVTYPFVSLSQKLNLKDPYFLIFLIP